MTRFGAGFFLAVAFLALGGRTLAQIDPDKRELVELGYNQAIQGTDPLAGYGFLYLNEPGCPWTNTTVRLAFAGVYLDSELGISHALGPNTDLGIGMAGGAFADNYYEFLRGKYLPPASFFGYGAEVSGSIYHLFDPGKRIPLYGIVSVRDRISIFQRHETSPGFELPHDHSTVALRTGLRFGGREPLLRPDLAMELSAWAEGQYRFDSGSYGYNGDRILQPNTEMFWARGLLIYTLPESKQTISATLNGGASLNPDRFSAYRMGGNLPMGSEFPLAIPGYFYQELSARTFVNFTAEYVVPLDPAKHWRLNAIGSVADVDYTPGLAQGGHFNSGIGAGLEYHSPTGMWQVIGAYGYGFEAIRDTGRGGQDVSLLCQIDLEARNGSGEPNSLGRFLHRFF